MAFSSIHFLFLFFPIFFILFILVPNQWYRNSILLLGSLVFFGWADPTHLHILIIAVLLNYSFGLLIELCQKRQKLPLAHILMGLAVILNLSLLVFYKYLGFIIGSVQALTGTVSTIQKSIMPLGLSYFTFSGISYLVDVYQTVEPAEKNLLKFSNYLIMFPKLLQGPITRFGQVKNELASMTFSSENAIRGVRRLILGLTKKVLIADNMAIMANQVFNTDLASLGAGVAWIGVISFTLQIFFDFAGYTDMAIGLGLILGFKLPENFNYPYISRSISDFWRRWHMTLTAWFRTYVFLPLEFARKKEKFLRQQSNIVIVFLLTGLWHGAGWNYIIWGVYFGIILAIEATGLGKLLKKAPRFLQHLYAILLIMIGWIFFRLTNIADWKPFFSILFGGQGWSGNATLRTLNILFYLPILVLAVILCTPIVKNIEGWIENKGPLARFILDIIYIIAFLLVIFYLVSNGYNSFFYQQF
jgi:alginate O-acetyltransferase complex protein AlgI